MTRWRQELIGHETDLADVADVFHSPPVRVIAVDGHFYLESDEFEPLSDHHPVVKAAQRTIDWVNGAMRLRGDGYQNVTLGPLHGDHGDGAWSTTLSHSTDAFVVQERSRIHKIGEGKSQAVSNSTTSIVELASHDQDVRDVLDLWANEPHDWVHVYKIYEIVRSRGRPAGIPKSQITRFTRTANHQDGAGRKARHARMSAEPPASPMSGLEAEHLIERLLCAWLLSLVPDSDKADHDDG